MSESSTQNCSCGHRPHFGRCEGQEVDNRTKELKQCTCEVISYKVDMEL